MPDRRKAKGNAPPQERRKDPRRAFARMPVSLWAVEDDGQGIYYHHVSDLSRGGLFLEKGLSLPVGTRMQFELTLSPGRSIRAEGVVVSERNGRSTIGNGIKFDKISDQDQAAIDSFIASRN